MIRVFALLLLATPAFAQGIYGPYPPPGIGFSGVNGGRAPAPLRIVPRFPTVTIAPTAPVYVYPSLYGYGFTYGFPYTVFPPFAAAGPGGPVPAPSETIPLPDLTPATPVAKDAAEATFTARLELTFPAAAKVWVDGKEVEGTKENDFAATSPGVRVGASHTFAVKAEWTVDGSKYAMEKTVAVKAGDRSKLTILAGDRVK